MKTKAEAMRVGKELAKVMGPGWKPRVWENLGWHVAVEKGVADVRPPYREGDDYNAEVSLEEDSLHTDGPIGLGVQFFGSHKDPQKAVAEALQRARKGIEANRKTLLALEKGIDALP